MLKNMSQKKIILIAADVLVFAALLVSFIATGEYGISKDDRASYDKAISAQLAVTALGFTDFRLEDYPVVICGVEKETVFFENDAYTRKPFMEASVGTATWVDGRMEIFVQSYADWIVLQSLTGGADEALISHVTEIWHEAFHAWQQTHCAEGWEILSAGLTENINIADSNPKFEKWFMDEQALLYAAVKAKTEEERSGYLVKWAALYDEEVYPLNAEEKARVEWQETMEGGGEYISSFIDYYHHQKALDKYEQRFIEPNDYDLGTGKFYQQGMYKFWLLNAINPAFASKFDMKTSVTKLLLKEVSYL